MDCERHNQNLSAYLDGRLSSRETTRVESHIRSCRRCREELAELKRLKDVLAALPDAESSPAFWSETFHSIRSARPSGRAVAIRRLQHGIAVCGVLATIMVLANLTRVEAPTSVPRSTEPTTIHADSLVALHTSLRTEMPLADTGTLRFARTTGIASDWANDHQLDFE